MKHPEISRWTRHEEGSYAAEASGFSLVVHWQPESAGRRGFRWVATSPEGVVSRSPELHEEIELAMAEAEAFAAAGGEPGDDDDEAE